MSETLRERYGYLPYFLRLVLEDKDEDLMLRLIVRCGGTRIFAGSNTNYTTLSDEDSEAIRAIMHRQSLTYLDVPVASNALYHTRDKRIAELRRQGKQLGEIARELGMTCRSVSRSLKRNREQTGIKITPGKIVDPRQIELF